MTKKQLFVFAGPNGSGKSTIVKNAVESEQCPAKFICPDNLVSSEDMDNPEAYLKAMQKAEAIRFLEIAQGNSFSFETVLSTKSKLDFIRYAKFNGYYVHVIYVTTENPEINIKRVKKRVEQGGHDVPEDKILSRYEKSMELMFDVICESDAADIYDNSGDKPELSGAKIDGVLCIRRNPPEWLKRYLISKAESQNVTLHYFK